MLRMCVEFCLQADALVYLLTYMYFTFAPILDETIQL